MIKDLSPQGGRDPKFNKQNFGEVPEWPKGAAC